MTIDLAKIRADIPALQELVYLNTGWSGPTPSYVMDAIEAGFGHEHLCGPTSPRALELGATVREAAVGAAAQLFGAEREEMLLTENTTEGLNIVLNGIDWREGDEVVICDLEHPSVLLPAYALRERRGIKLRIVTLAPNTPQDEIVFRFVESLSADTRLVMLSHVQYSTGLRMPVAQIAEQARRVDSMVLVDGAQGPGHLALDMKELGVDFYSSPGQKWLLGPDQTGALFIRRDMIPSISPARVGFGFAESFDSKGSFEPRTDSIDKFMVSTTSVPLKAGYLAAVNGILEIGPREVEERQIALGDRLRARLSDMPGVEVLSPLSGKGRSALTSFSVSGLDPTDVTARLLALSPRPILVRHISFPQAVRASTAFFNSEEEVDLLADSIGDLVRST